MKHAAVASRPTGRQRALVYVAGVRWDGATGTDHHLVRALAGQHRVLWVDPYQPYRRRHTAQAGRSLGVPGLQQIDSALWRLMPVGPPGITRPGVRQVAALRLPSLIRRAAAALGWQPGAAIVSSAMVAGRTLGIDPWVMLATDDFVAGAALMGLSPRHLSGIWDDNVRHASAVVAISPALADEVRDRARRVAFIPNGCDTSHFAPTRGPRRDLGLPAPIAGVVGQLNDRLDVELLAQVAERGMSLLMVGPRVEREPATSDGLDALIASPKVRWLGHVPYAEVPSILDAIDVGLTPYRLSAFNDSSFPLKTLEYLAAGLPVVSTDLPSSRWLDTPLVRVARHSEFADAVVETAHQRIGPDVSAECRRFASGHDWSRRAEQLTDLLAAHDGL